MLGIVFTEFCEMVEDKYSPDLLDEVLETSEAALNSGGIYTAVGDYDHNEMLVLVANLAERTQSSVPELVRIYGYHLFGRFLERYPSFFSNIGDSLTFLENVETHIHREVQKLYPTAQLPTFTCERQGGDSMTMIYKSARPFSMLALGLIEGCGDHFKERLQIDYTDLSDGNMTSARFVINRKQANDQ